ncbi:MAG: dienelactone hydrolase family protein [Nevskiales bacterium]
MTDPGMIPITETLQGYYAAPPQAGAAPGIVVLMEAFGLTPHIRRVCDRFAAAGFAALAPDIYDGKQFSYDKLDEAMGTLKALRDDQVMAEIGASFDYMAGQPGVAPAQLGVVGFCMGGRLAFLAACRHAARVRASVAYYGGAIFPEGEKDRFGRTPPIGEAAALAAPLLLIYGGKDGGITPAEHARITQRLGELDKRYALSLHPGAGHGFCCEDRPSYAPKATEDAHAEAIDFLKRSFAA